MSQTKTTFGELILLLALHTYAWVLWSCGLLVLIATCVLYALSVRSAQKHWKQCSTSVAIVLSVYPIVAAAGFIAILVPRARIIAEAIAQEAVMVAMYQFFCMMIFECGGYEQIIRRTTQSRLETRTLPCCCWPCCVIPRPEFKKRTLECLRYLILQMPVCQALLYIIILVLRTEDMTLYLQSFVYIQPFIATSILSGMWGIIMCVRTLESLGHRPKPRFLVLQLVLIIVKLQCGFAKILPDLVSLPCIMPLHPTVFVNMIQNSVMMLEMLVLSIWAWRLYRKPPGKDLDKVNHIVVAVLEDNARGLEANSFREGIENKSFNNKCEP